MEFNIKTDDDIQIKIDTEKKTITYSCQDNFVLNAKKEFVTYVLCGKPFPKIVDNQSLLDALEYVYIKKFQVGFE